jgi:hypothetical protein
MQFSYQVSEADYRRAFKLRTSGRNFKILMFWAFILVCLLMLWAVVSKTNARNSEDSAPPVTQSDQDSQAPAPGKTSMSRSLLMNLGPVVLVVGVLVFLRPMILRRAYRKDPAMQGTYTIDLTPGAISIQNTSGFSTEAGWNLYDFWKQGKGVIILVGKSGTFFILSIARLSEPQREELRGILSAALPKK